MSWNDKSKKFALDSARDGNSASQIAKLLFKQFGITKTRNAVIGLVFRSGQAFPVDRSSSARRGGRIAAARFKAARKGPDVKPAPTFTAEPLPPPSETDIPRKSLLALEDNDCRFPVGDGRPQMFCADEKVPGHPYCLPHVIRCDGSSRLRERYQRPAIGRILLNANGVMASELESV